MRFGWNELFFGIMVGLVFGAVLQSLHTPQIDQDVQATTWALMQQAGARIHELRAATPVEQRDDEFRAQVNECKAAIRDGYALMGLRLPEGAE